MMYAQYLASIVYPAVIRSAPPTVQPTHATRKSYPLGKHTDSKRFTGSKVKLYSPTVSPDYPFIARIDSTSENGAVIHMSWIDHAGRKCTGYSLRPEDELIVLALKDSEASPVLTRPSTPATVPTAPRKHSAALLNGDPLLVLQRFMRKNGIGHTLDSDRIYFLYNRYYVEFDKRYELCSESKGVLVTYPHSKAGIEGLLKRMLRMEDNFNAERLLAKESV